MAQSKSAQDFLKAVHQLQQPDERVSTTALAAVLAVAAPSVTDMAIKLCRAGLLDYRKHHGMRLTQAGEQAAQGVITRHIVIEQYLIECLGYDPDEAHQEAEQMEHTVSDRFVLALLHLMDRCAAERAIE
jgi:DtxR family transcriptional regulator, Mn-dependent transcriptional regulator